MRTHVIARKTHKWLGLFIGLQVVIWSLSGVYMTVVHIDTIHGDHLVRPAPDRSVTAASLADPIALAAKTEANSIRLAWLREQPIYVTASNAGEVAFDAKTGRIIPAQSEAAIRELARSYYTGGEPIASAKLITDIPGEIRGRKPPLWRVEFDHWNKPTFYLSPVTGELLSRRHELWRIFDFVWMLHIMDYEARENVNNSLLRTFTWGAVLMALSGIWLLFYSFHRKKKKKAVHP
ncbi:MAG TPA: PepSY domain-containing protein [Sphingomicrobium sp.]|nr:PepSY domain-containing protein [Sphingomicrobium sp.]